MKEFEGKVAIVTGTSGIGRAAAERLARDGSNVLALGIDDSFNDKLGADAAREGLSLRVRRCDLAQAGQVEEAIEVAVRDFGGLDLVVNAAAVHPYGDVIETDLTTWDRCMRVNVTGMYLICHFALPELQRRGGGAIVNVSSVQGFSCQQGVAAYATSKGAIHSLTRALALDHAKDGIRVNSVSPGSVRTPLLELSAKRFSPDISLEDSFARFGKAHPLGRIAEPEEVAEMIAFLLSRRAGFCTGGDYLVDGGLTAQLGAQ